LIYYCLPRGKQVLLTDIFYKFINTQYNTCSSVSIT
jgi:hypothetical protein